MSDLHPQLLSDALSVLDRYSAAIPDRDPVKSLNEDRTEDSCPACASPWIR